MRSQWKSRSDDGGRNWCCLTFLCCIVMVVEVQSLQRTFYHHHKWDRRETVDKFMTGVDILTAVIEDIFLLPNNFTSHSVVRNFTSELSENSTTDVKLQQPRSIAEGGQAVASTGRNSFLAGFGLGFLAFGLKKLMLPFFIGAQIFKSLLLALFLPSILGSLGKIFGKGLASFSGASGASGQNRRPVTPTHIDDFDFKDTGVDPYNPGMQEYNVDGEATNESSTIATSKNSRFGIADQHLVPPKHTPSSSSLQNSQYYIRKPYNKKTNYNIFHKIPPSSLLLTNYDPFYSPLLSRVDSVFQKFGLVNEKSQDIERCREKLVCLMYANPTKYAPYSNLVSAQLSRELSELKRPTSDNPEILRFFKYMRAAKDGQDDGACSQHKGCSDLQYTDPSHAIITTYNEINKLVEARKLH